MVNYSVLVWQVLSVSGSKVNMDRSLNAVPSEVGQWREQNAPDHQLSAKGPVYCSDSRSGIILLAWMEMRTGFCTVIQAIEAELSPHCRPSI